MSTSASYPQIMSDFSTGVGKQLHDAIVARDKVIKAENLNTPEIAPLNTERLESTHPHCQRLQRPEV